MTLLHVAEREMQTYDAVVPLAEPEEDNRKPEEDLLREFTCEHLTGIPTVSAG